jgi:hypothetical protein
MATQYVGINRRKIGQGFVMGGTGSGKWARPLAPCGTTAAYQRHRKRGEDCSLCKAANTRKRIYKPKVNGRNPVTRIKGRIAIIEEKLRRGCCMDCQMVVTRNNYMCFDFDHRDPAKKSFAISAKSRDVAEAVLQAEFAKCDLVCANCHRLRTHVQIKTGVMTGKKATHQKVDIAPTLFDIAN